MHRCLSGIGSSDHTLSSNGTGTFSSAEVVSSSQASVMNWSMVAVCVMGWHRLWCTEDESSALPCTWLLASALECWLCCSLGLTGLSSLELVSTNQWCVRLWHLCLKVRALHVALQLLVIDQSSQDWRINPPSWRHGRSLVLCWEGWGCWSSHSHSHNLHPPWQAQFQKHHSW